MMSHPKRLARKIPPILFFLLLALVIILIVIKVEARRNLQYSSHSFFTASSTTLPFFNFSSNVEDERISIDDVSIWCLEMGSRLDAEKTMPRSPRLRSPSTNASGLRRLPYRYSDWKSSPLLPRRVTACEHTLIMRLLMIIERICREHHLTFFMSDGTLLGSWRHHDIIPWDDDVDVAMPIEQQSTLLNVLNQSNDTLVRHYSLYRSKTQRDYYKVFFRHTPSAGGYTWTFPFVDIFFFATNVTHLWYVHDFSTIAELKHVFPLVMRPFGYLWLPAPRKPQHIFQFDPNVECDGHWWNHRTETYQNEVKLNCSDLYDVYPFVQRKIQTESIEVLTMNNTIIHTIVY